MQNRVYAFKGANFLLHVKAKWFGGNAKGLLVCEHEKEIPKKGARAYCYPHVTTKTFQMMKTFHTPLSNC